MRRWLLACVGILLGADGYWASQNLVLKSADDGIYWIPFDPMITMSIEKDDAGKAIRQPSARPEISWESDQWFADGIPATDVTQFFEYLYDERLQLPSDCLFKYQIGVHSSATSAFKSIEAAFDAGADRVVILSPEPEMLGRVNMGVLVFNSTRPGPRYCNFD